MRTRERVVVLTLALGAGAGCARHVPCPVDVPTVAASVPAPPAGPLAYEDAVRWALTHNPELRALRARAAAVRTRIPPEPFGVDVGVSDEGDPEAGITLDALSLLGIGPRRAERALARARLSEARLAHHERAREVAAQIAEAYVVEAVYAGMEPPTLDLDASAYVRAGLAPAAAESAVAAADAALRAERAAAASARAANRRVLLRLLGARPDAAIQIRLPAVGWPELPSPDERALLAARADLQRLLAAYEVAEAEVEKAVAAQYPSIELKPAVGGDPTTLFGGVGVRIPVDAGEGIRVAGAARDAARLDLEAAVLDALRDAATAREEAETATALRDAAAAQRTAAGDLLRAARAQLEVESGSFVESVLAASEVVGAATAWREASVEAARSRVRAARAAGWPPPQSFPVP